MLRARYRRIVFFFARMLFSLALWELLLPRLGMRSRTKQTRSERLRQAAISFRRLAIRTRSLNSDGSNNTCARFVHAMGTSATTHTICILYSNRRQRAVDEAEAAGEVVEVAAVHAQGARCCREVAFVLVESLADVRTLLLPQEVPQRQPTRTRSCLCAAGRRCTRQ